MIIWPLTMPETIVHFTSSICSMKSAVYGMKSSRVVSPRNADNTRLLMRPGAGKRARSVPEPLDRDFRSFHLPDERGVGERIEIRKRFEVDAVGLAREEQGV